MVVEAPEVEVVNAGPVRHQREKTRRQPYVVEPPSEPISVLSPLSNKSEDWERVQLSRNMMLVSQGFQDALELSRQHQQSIQQNAQCVSNLTKIMGNFMQHQHVLNSQQAQLNAQTNERLNNLERALQQTNLQPHQDILGAELYMPPDWDPEIALAPSNPQQQQQQQQQQNPLLTEALQKNRQFLEGQANSTVARNVMLVIRFIHEYLQQSDTPSADFVDNQYVGPVAIVMPHHSVAVQNENRGRKMTERKAQKAREYILSNQHIRISHVMLAIAIRTALGACYNPSSIKTILCKLDLVVTKTLFTAWDHDMGNLAEQCVFPLKDKREQHNIIITPKRVFDEALAISVKYMKPPLKEVLSNKSWEYHGNRTDRSQHYKIVGSIAQIHKNALRKRIVSSTFVAQPPSLLTHPPALLEQPPPLGALPVPQPLLQLTYQPPLPPEQTNAIPLFHEMDLGSGGGGGMDILSEAAMWCTSPLQ